MDHIKNFKTKYIFPPITRYLGYLISAIGLLGLLAGALQSIFFILLGLGLSFSRYVS